MERLPPVVIQTAADNAMLEGGCSMLRMRSQRCAFREQKKRIGFVMTMQAPPNFSIKSGENVSETQ